MFANSFCLDYCTCKSHQNHSDLLPKLADEAHVCTDPRLSSMFAGRQVLVSLCASTRYQRVQKGDLLLHLHFGKKEGVIVHACLASSEMQFLIEPMVCSRSVFGNLADWRKPSGSRSLMLAYEIDQFCHPMWWLKQDDLWLTLR